MAALRNGHPSRQSVNGVIQQTLCLCVCRWGDKNNGYCVCGVMFYEEQEE